MTIAEKTVLYTMPGLDAVTIERHATMDVYTSPSSDARSVVVIVAGYPDAGFERIVGCRFKDMGSTVSWAKLIAASGMTAIAYTNNDPQADLHHLLERITSSGSSEFPAFLGGERRQSSEEHRGTEEPEERRVALWASSGNGPLALSALNRVQCAALCYPYLLDLDGFTDVADAAKMFRFTNPQASFDDLPQDKRLFLVRAGRDETPNLNASLDRFVARALAANFPITVANHPDAPHAFDLSDNSRASFAIIEQLLSWLRGNL